MREQFKIEIVNWLAGYGSAAEARATFAEISIYVNNLCVTDVEDRFARTTRKSVRVSAYPLACWIAANWWRLLCEPARRGDGSTARHDWDMSHRLTASGGGYVWPNLLLWSYGVEITAHCTPQWMPDDLSPLRYLNLFEVPLPAGVVEEGFATFIEEVLRRLHESGLRDTNLHALWKDLAMERAHGSLTETRKLEALLGIDPEEGNELLKEAPKWQKQVGKHAVEEIAAGSSPKNFIDTFARCKQAAQTVKAQSRVEKFDCLRAEILEHSSPEIPPASAGRSAAHVVRQIWELGDQVVTNAVLAERLNLGAQVFESSTPGTPLTFGVKGRSEDQMKVVLRDTHPRGKRFDVARLIGDHLRFDYGEAWKPATSSFTARQKFQRAFASELLCPSEVVRSRYRATAHTLAGSDDFVEMIADEYQVSQFVVQNYLFPEEPGFETRMGRAYAMTS
jgi:hypothetical protein